RCAARGWSTRSSPVIGREKETSELSLSPKNKYKNRLALLTSHGDHFAPACASDREATTLRSRTHVALVLFANEVSKGRSLDRASRRDRGARKLDGYRVRMRITELSDEALLASLDVALLEGHAVIARIV